MLTLYLLIGKKKFILYEKTNGQYMRRYIDGSPCFPYDLNHIENSVTELLDALTNEYNLSTKAGIDFIIIENQDPIYTKIVKNALEKYTVETHTLDAVLAAAIKKLCREKELMIDKLGINFDGINYRINDDSLKKGHFSLLGYSLPEDELLNLGL